MRRFASFLIGCGCLFSFQAIVLGGAARDFNGSSDYVDPGSASVLDNVTTYTAVARWYADTFAAVGGVNRILNKYGTSAAQGPAHIEVYEIDVTDAVSCFWSASTTNVLSISVANTAQTGKWFFHAATYNDAGDRLCRIYIATGNSAPAETSYVTHTAGAGTLNTDAANNVQIGRLGNNTNYFDGRIDYVMLFNRVLTAAEIQSLEWNPMDVPNGLVGFWPVWGSASPETDLSGNNNTGTVTGTSENANGPPVFITAWMP